MTDAVTKKPIRRPEDEIAGAHLRSLRKKARLTQETLAAGIPGVDRSLVSNFERGERSITESYAERFATKLGVSPTELLPVRRPAPLTAEDTSPLDRLAALEGEGAELKRACIALLRIVELLAEQVEGLGGHVPRDALEAAALAMLRTPGGVL